MKYINDIMVFFIVLMVGCNVASNFSYNILIQHKTPKWMIFIQHPYLSIKNRFGTEVKTK